MAKPHRGSLFEGEPLSAPVPGQTSHQIIMQAMYCVRAASKQFPHLLPHPPEYSFARTPESRGNLRYPTLKTPGGLVRLLDYVGTVSFAMSGSATAGMRGMNLLGCLFVGIMAATGGGTIRDLLMGQTPVFWLVEVRALLF